MSKLLVVMLNVSKLFKIFKFEDYNDPLKVFYDFHPLLAITTCSVRDQQPLKCSKFRCLDLIINSIKSRGILSSSQLNFLT